MTESSQVFQRHAKAQAEAASLDGTVRIEHDRRRLALTVLAGSIGTLAMIGWLTLGIGRAHRTSPTWTLALFGFALLAAVLGMLRNLYKLQDADPAIVISPRGLSFRPHVLGEIAHIPWSAVRGIKTRKYKQIRFIAIQVDDVDRYVPRVGLLAGLRRLGNLRSPADEVSFSTPMSKSAWAATEALLRRYLERYGRSPSAVAERSNAIAPRQA